MRPRQLEVFRMIMRCGTITGAAQALNVSQPALSQTLLHTEEELGLKLFERTKGRLVPTAEAEDLFIEVDRIFNDLSVLKQRALDMRQGKGGSIRLVASAPPSLSFVPTALGRFRNAHPDVRILSYVVPVASVTAMLDRGQAGLGVAMYDRPLPLIETELLGYSRIVCALPKGHPLAAKTEISFDDLKRESIISYRYGSLPNELLSDALAREGMKMRCDIEIDMSFVALSFVQQGLGLGLVDDLVPWENFGGLVTRPFLPRVALPVCVLTSTRRPLSLNHQLLRECLRKGAAALGLCKVPEREDPVPLKMSPPPKPRASVG